MNILDSICAQRVNDTDTVGSVLVSKKIKVAVRTLEAISGIGIGVSGISCHGIGISSIGKKIKVAVRL